MTKTLVFHRQPEYDLAAVMVDGSPFSLFAKRRDEQTQINDIYLGKVEKVVPGLQAAFVNLGLAKNGYLPLDEINVKPGDVVLVRVVKNPTAQKGAKLSTVISLPGRNLVYFPQKEMKGISRKLTEDKREYYHRVLENLNLPGGFIVRTLAGEEEDLLQEAKRLYEEWQGILERSKTAQAPALLYKEDDLFTWCLRELLDKDFTALYVDDFELLEIGQKFRERFRVLLPPIYKSFNVMEEFNLIRTMEKLTRERVWLKNGGILVIEKTEALTAIDVNSGKFTGKKDLKETAFKINLEAAREIAKQIRLRNIGGIIVVDFISLLEEERWEEILRVMEEEFLRDKAKVKITGKTPSGLVEIARQKIGLSIGELFTHECSVCQGTGRITDITVKRL
ncbi:Rne/Rng family ribonuclease [Carboxydothermus hydrogenoformans]|uniref:Ribonuclease, Rne/Rng family n=1 Tax=Carboxydothermus hydrogenoformans (strain ATCC BAA-161 / DSM 6008 / Z-2901) TaxID=246194 RepID=Q3AF57_CARHZ|nr:Rne/Rng family ribonuclease [Carboxydothermus hydrogenoformans]ABB15666.1 ribonuclease, Rne/Rng family [Carboxydothermus hydrogenoformans Z-2901]